MAGLNLLPWREEARKKSQQTFVIMVAAGVAFGAISVFAAYTYHENEIAQQMQRNNYIKAETKRIEKDIKTIKD